MIALFEVDDVAGVIGKGQPPFETARGCIIEQWLLFWMNMKCEVVGFVNEFISEYVVQVAVGI